MSKKSEKLTKKGSAPQPTTTTINRSDSKRNQVIAYMKTVDQATLRQIYDNVYFRYYNNWNRYLGQIMSVLVNDGVVKRIKPGVFTLVKKQDTSQLNLF